MIGREDSLDNKLIENNLYSGIIPKSAGMLFEILNNEYNNLTNEIYTVKVSFIELYNEKVNDLIAGPSHSNINIMNEYKIRYNNEQGYFFENVILIKCLNSEEIIEILFKGISNRNVSSNYINPNSSRSHSILTIYILNHKFNKISSLTFVDLAGSERISYSINSNSNVVNVNHNKFNNKKYIDKNKDDIMIRETGSINKSLLVLGKVISILSERGNYSNIDTIKLHVPIRESKLTMLLSNSFSGNSKTIIIGCISSAGCYVDETINTLNFLSKANNIQNKPYIGAVRIY